MMTAPQKPQQEPTMEEILASIRRIIADDNQPATAEAPSPTADESDILTLTQVVEEPPPELGESRTTAAAPIPEPKPEPSFAPESSFTPEPTPPPEAARASELPPQSSPMPESSPMAESSSAPESPSRAAFDEALLSAAAAAATSAAFAGLAGSAAPVQPAAPVALGGGKTVEEIVRDLLRPMLKDWLDANLPDLTERLVRAEVERLGRRFRE